MKHPRRAFTVLELIVTISVILVLMGLVVVAFVKIKQSTTAKATVSALEAGRSMLAELDAVDRKNGMASIDFIFTTPVVLNPMPCPGDVTVDAFNSGVKDRYQSPAVLRTQIAMRKLLSVPNNRSMIEKIPAERLMKAKVPPMADDTPLLLDAWGNPIILVPRLGLTIITAYNSSATYKAGTLVSSGGVFRSLKSVQGVAPPDTAHWEQVTPTPTGNEVTAPDRRPFWASAGPDGDFLASEDNVYSFNN